MDMPFSAVVTDINTIDEAHRGFYKETDGKFVLDVTPTEGFALENITGLTNALGAERNLKKSLEDTVKKFEGIDAQLARQAIARVSEFGDITPEQAKEALETAKTLSALDPKKDAERIAEEKIRTATDQLKSSLTTQFTAREKELTTALESTQSVATALKSQLKMLLVDNQLQTQLSALNPLDDAREAITLLAEKHIQTTELSDGTFQVQVIDAQGNPRVKMKDGQIVAVTVADLLAEVREKSPSLFKADEKNGIGVKPTTGSSQGSFTGPNPFMKGKDWNMTKQAVLINTQPELAARLKAAAAGA